MTLTKKVGPLPVWGWGAAVALGILIWYLRSRSSGAMANGAIANTSATPPVLDPTQGGFDMPTGISSGGTSPGMVSYDPNAIADAVSAQLIPVLSTLPFASTPGDPQTPTTGVDEVGDVVKILQALRDGGLIQAPPPASTGAATSQAQKHDTNGKKVSERVLHKNAKSGQTYRVMTNPHGKPHGTYHVYGRGRSARFVPVKTR